MSDTLDMPTLVDGDDFSEARGRRRFRKRRYGLNKALGYIPAIAAVRYFKDKRDSDFDGDDFSEARGLRRRRPSTRRRPTARRRQMPNERSAAMKRYQSPPKKKYLDTENSAIARFQRERPTPKRRKPSSERPMDGKRRIKTTPLPEGLEPKQGVMANQQSKNNKMLWIAGGIVGVLILGYFIFKKKK